MIDEEQKENSIEEKLENAIIKLKGIEKEDEIVYEKGKILFPIKVPLLAFLLFFLGFFLISSILFPTVKLGFGIVFIASAFIIGYRYNYYSVLDYEKQMIYKEIRNKGNKSLSKDILIKSGELLAVGVNNRICIGSNEDGLGDIVTDEREESEIVLLKSNGELLSLQGFRSKHYPNDCLIADAISILYDVPAVKSEKEWKLKVIKEGLDYKLSAEPLKRDSLMVNFLKQAARLIIYVVFGIIVILVLNHF
jgi:hypothetical protein